MKVDYSAIGERIRERRNHLGYSQEQLAFDCDLSVPYISQVENGRKSVSLNALLQIADIFECTLDWLVFGDDENRTFFAGYDFNIPVENCTKEEKEYLYNLLAMNIRLLEIQRERITADRHHS